MCRKIVLGVVSVCVLWGALLGQSKSRSEVDKLVSYADELFDMQNRGKAREYYIKTVTYYPKSKYQEYAEFMIGKAFVLDGGWAYYYGYEELEEFLGKYPKSKYCAEAKKLMEYVLKMIQKDETPPRTTSEENLALKYIGFGDDFLSRSASSGEYGMVYNQDELDQALYWYNKVLAELPDTWYATKAQYNKGAAYTKQEKQADYEKAIGEFQKVVDNYPDDIYHGFYRRIALRTIGDVYRDSLRDKKKAIAAYEELIELDKDNPDSFYLSYAKAQINFLK